MGLDISNNTWSGGYSSFMNWRRKIAQIAGYPPLDLMEGFYSNEGHFNPFMGLEYDYPKGDELSMSALRRIKKELPIKWDNFRPNPLIELLTHSDCDGTINWSKCEKLAKELEKLLPLFTEEDVWYKEKTEIFIEGLMYHFVNKKKVEFY